MTKWNNYGIKVNDKSKIDDIISTLENIGLRNIRKTDNKNIKSIHNTRPNTPSKEQIKKVLANCYTTKDIIGMVFVSVNGSNKEASGIEYAFTGNSWTTKDVIQYNSGQETREDWKEIIEDVKWDSQS